MARGRGRPRLSTTSTSSSASAPGRASDSISSRQLAEHFHHAVKESNVAKVQALLKDPKLDPNVGDPTWDGYPIVAWSASTPGAGSEAVLALLIANSRVNLKTALDGSVENFRMLFFSAKVDVHRRNRFGHSAFYYACCRGKSLEMVDLMLERLASVGNKTALIELGTQVDANVNPTCVPLESVKTHVRQTLSFGSANAEQIPAWLRPSSGSPLEQLKDAISERNRKRFDDLLCLRESRVIANLADENGMIPLIWAAAHEEDDKGNVFYMVRKLLPMTLDPNNRDKWGRTAFYYACTFNNVNLVQRLYADPPVDIELADIFGNKPSEAQMQHMWFADATTTKLVQKEIDRRATKKKAEMERKEGEAARNEPREDDESPEQSPRKRRRMSEASDDSVIVLHKNLEDRSATDVEQDEQMEDSELGNGVEDRSLFDQAESSDVIGLNSEMQLQKHDVDPGSCALTPSRPASPVIEHPEPTTVPDKLTAESGQEMSTGALDPVSAPEAEHPPPVPKPKPWRCTVPGCSKAYTTKRYRDSHEWTHKPQEEWPVQCQDCGKRFTERKRVKRHKCPNVPTTAPPSQPLDTNPKSSASDEPSESPSLFRESSEASTLTTASPLDPATPTKPSFLSLAPAIKDKLTNDIIKKQQELANLEAELERRRSEFAEQESKLLKKVEVLEAIALTRKELGKEEAVLEPFSKDLDSAVETLDKFSRESLAAISTAPLDIPPDLDEDEKSMLEADSLNEKCAAIVRRWKSMEVFKVDVDRCREELAEKENEAKERIDGLKSALSRLEGQLGDLLGV